MNQTSIFQPYLFHFVLPKGGRLSHEEMGSDSRADAKQASIRQGEPVFVVGSPRSGTSIFTWCLGQHPDILPQEESVWTGILSYFIHGCFQIGAARGERSQLSAMGISAAEMCEALGNAIDGLICSRRERFRALADEAARRDPEGVNPAFALSRSDSEPKQRWVDGTPENSFYIPALRHLFPRAKFIHIVRDVELVVRSLLNFAGDGLPIVANEAEAYSYWLRTVDACVAAEQAYGSDVVLRIRYRDLVHSPETTLERCFAFLGEPFANECVEPLGTRINSSRVPAEFDPFDPATDPRLRDTSRDLCRKLLAEEVPHCEPDPAKIEVLEREFVARSRHVTRASTDLEQALVCLADAERELAGLRERTSHEVARELVHTRTPYNALVVVALGEGEPIPYLNGREPLPLRIPRALPPETQEALVARLEEHRAAGGSYLLMPDSLRDSPEWLPSWVESMSRYRVVKSLEGWTLYRS